MTTTDGQIKFMHEGLARKQVNPVLKRMVEGVTRTSAAGQAKLSLFAEGRTLKLEEL
jgi:hypothetical protein